MFLLYSSDSSVRYLQDVLDCIAYPPGQVVQFRYDAKYVDPSISGWPTRSDGKGQVWIDRQKVALDNGKQGSTGYFFSPAPTGLPNLEEAGSDEQQSWEQVAEVLGGTREFAASTFFRLASIRTERYWL